MKRLLALVAGGLGLRAFLKRRSRPLLSPDPAEDLRARLAQTKSSEAPAAVQEAEPAVEAGPAPEAEPAAEAGPAPEPASIEDRRADVHSKARRAIDDLKS